jgi:hypothetical protein
MRDKDKRVWFSGDTCNIEMNATIAIRDIILTSTKNVMNYITDVRKVLKELEEG